jgi:hypothetical protein
VKDNNLHCPYFATIIILLLLFIPLSLCTEHRASTVPCHPRLLFQFLGSIRHLVGLLGGGISQAQGLYLHRTTQHRKTQTNFHALSRIWTCDPNVWAAEDSTCLRPLGHWDQPTIIICPLFSSLLLTGFSNAMISKVWLVINYLELSVADSDWCDLLKLNCVTRRLLLKCLQCSILFSVSAILNGCGTSLLLLLLHLISLDLWLIILGIFILYRISTVVIYLWITFKWINIVLFLLHCNLSQGEFIYV